MSKELDELDGLFYVKMADGFTQGGTLTDDSKQAIKALISTAVREARIDELIGVRGWTEYEPDPKYSPAERFHIVPYTYLTKRIEELKRSKE